MFVMVVRLLIGKHWSTDMMVYMNTGKTKLLLREIVCDVVPMKYFAHMGETYT
jgi:hypothetical protein